MGQTGRVAAPGYRLRRRTFVRVLWVVVYGLCIFLLASGIGTSPSLVWTAVSVAGIVIALVGLRAVLGRAVLVESDALVLQPYWPRRRRLPWYRIDHVEVVPESWSLVVELNSGERIALPCVEQVDDLYERVERHRRALDSI